MEDTKAMQKTGGDGVPAREENAVRQFSDKEVALLKRTICQGATDEELSMFIQNCKRYGLDPFTGQIHAVKRWDSNAGREVLNVQVGIDGFRLIADRTGKWEGTLGPYWCGSDGEWNDVWLSDGFPEAAKVGVLRSDFSEPRWGIARWGAYVATKKNGDPNYMWKKMSAHMLAKCAEALALRSAFPNDLSGLYTDAEMDQAGDNDKRTYDGPDPKEVDAEVVSGKAQRSGPTPQKNGQKTSPSKSGSTTGQQGGTSTDKPEASWRAPAGDVFGGIHPNAKAKLEEWDDKLSEVEDTDLAARVTAIRNNVSWDGPEANALSRLLSDHEQRLADYEEHQTEEADAGNDEVQDPDEVAEAADSVETATDEANDEAFEDDSDLPF